MIIVNNKTKYLIISVILLLLCLGLFFFFQKKHKEIYVDFNIIEAKSKTFGKTIALGKGRDTLYFVKIEEIVEPLNKKSNYTLISIDSVFNIFKSNDEELLMKNNNEYEVYFIKRELSPSRNIIFMKTHRVILLGQDKF